MQTLVVQAMQWAPIPDMNRMEHDFTDTDAECLAEIRTVLMKHGKLERFGLTLLHKHFDVADDECLLETIDATNRTLVVRPVPRSTLGQAVQTQWRLDAVDPLLWCESYCNRTSNGDHQHGHQRNIDR
jgi:hypothetical protein